MQPVDKEESTMNVSTPCTAALPAPASPCESTTDADVEGLPDDAGAIGGENESAEITKKQKWKVWLASALQAFWILGLVQSFGIFQRYYGSDAASEDGIIRPQDQLQKAAISAINSLGNGGLVGAFAFLFYARLPKIGNQIQLLCFGSALLVAIGFASAATCHTVWTLLLTQGLLVGVGGGVFLNVLPAILPEYFGRNSGLALGAMLSCASVGGGILSVALPKLLESVGPRWTLALLAVLSMMMLGAASLLAEPPRKCQRRKMQLLGWKTFKDPVFTLLFAVNFVVPLTLAIPATFGPDFSEALGIDVKTASIYLAIGSFAGVPSRLLMGVVADFVGHSNTLFLATSIFAMGTLVLWLRAAQTSAETIWVAYTVLYGVVFGVFATVNNSVPKMLFGEELYFAYNGVLTSIRGVGYVVATPIAGALVTRGKDSELRGTDFVTPIAYMGALLTISSVCLAGVRGFDARRNGWKWRK